MGQSITSANAVLALSIDTIFTAPQQIQGFGVDDAWDAEQVNNAEIQLGVDGLMSVGWLPTLIKLPITVQANSPSIEIFDTWVQTENQNQEKLFANGTLSAPALGKLWTLTQGIISNYLPFPPGKKVLMPQKFEITFRTSVAQGV